MAIRKLATVFRPNGSMTPLYKLGLKCGSIVDINILPCGKLVEVIKKPKEGKVYHTEEGIVVVNNILLNIGEELNTINTLKNTRSMELFWIESNGEEGYYSNHVDNIQGAQNLRYK